MELLDWLLTSRGSVILLSLLLRFESFDAGFDFNKLTLFSAIEGTLGLFRLEIVEKDISGLNA